MKGFRKELNYIQDGAEIIWSVIRALCSWIFVKILLAIAIFVSIAFGIVFLIMQVTAKDNWEIYVALAPWQTVLLVFYIVIASCWVIGRMREFN